MDWNAFTIPTDRKTPIYTASIIHKLVFLEILPARFNKGSFNFALHHYRINVTISNKTMKNRTLFSLWFQKVVVRTKDSIWMCHVPTSPCRDKNSSSHATEGIFTIFGTVFIITEPIFFYYFKVCVLKRPIWYFKRSFGTAFIFIERIFQFLIR